MSSILTPPVIISGRESFRRLKELKELEGKSSALLIVDRTKVDKEVENKCKQDLESLGMTLVEFHEFVDQVSLSNLELALDRARAGAVDVVIAAGGRAAIQAGKILGLLLTNGGRIEDIADLDGSNAPPLAVIAIAMTNSGGAEATDCACYLDEKTRLNTCLTDRRLVPVAALLDPGLSTWRSSKDIAGDGVVSIGYAVEALVSVTATPVSEVCVLSAIELIFRWLPVAYAHNADVGAREQLLYAQQLISMVANNTAPRILCKLAGQIEASTHIPHSNVIAALLPSLLDYLEETNPERTARIAEAMRNGNAALHNGAEVLTAAGELRVFLEFLGMPLRLSFMGMDELSLKKVSSCLGHGTCNRTGVRQPDQIVLNEIIRQSL